MYGHAPYSTVPISTLPASGPPGAITFVTSTRIPLGGTVTATVKIVLGSSRPLPLGGSVVLKAGIAATSTRALPRGGTVAIAVRITGASAAQRLPLGGSITIGHVQVGGGNALPLWRWAGRGRALAARLRPAIRLESVCRLPLGGEIGIIVANDPEASIDDLLLALLSEDDVHAF